MSDHTATRTDWKDEYRTLIREVESSERSWRKNSELLRRAGSQIAIAAMGQSELLDQQLQLVVDELRGEVEPARLQSALDELSSALRQLPRSVDATAADTEIAVIMRELVTRVSNAPVFREASRPLAATMERALADNDWVGLARGLADTVAEVTSALERQKDDLSNFLEEVTRQLAQFEELTDWHHESSLARRADSESLAESVDTEMRGMRDDVDSGEEISALKSRVQSRLESVAARFEAFRRSEAARDAEAEERSAALMAEVEILRNRTMRLSQTLEQTEDKLLYDLLTGVHSRYAYEQRIKEEFHRWQRHGAPLSFALWDVDRFKRVNDEFGHAAGDKLLKLVGQLIGGGMREEDFVARIGGEEFAVLLPGTDLEEARRQADRIRETIAGTPFHYKGNPEQVTISCGLTAFRDGDSPESVFERADRALYRAKDEGRNRCVCD